MIQAAVRSLVGQYFAGPLRRQPAFRHLEPVLAHAPILVVGSYSIGMARPDSDVDIEVLVPDGLYPAMLGAAGGPRGLWVHDEAHQPLVDVKVRSLQWLRRRLDGTSPEVLWIYEQAVRIQDPGGDVVSLLEHAWAHFPAVAAELVPPRYRDLRAGVTVESTRESLARHVMLGQMVEAALVLPFLAWSQAHPYPKWQAWWLTQHHPDGAEIVALCEQVLAGQPAMRRLREILDALLTEAGYGDSLIRDFWRRL